MSIFKKKEKKENKSINYQPNSSEESVDDYLYKPLFFTIEENLSYIKKYQGDSWDFVIQEFTLENRYQEINISLLYYAGMVDQNLLNKTVIDALNKNFSKAPKLLEKGEMCFKYLKTKVLTAIGIDEAENFGMLFNKLLSGDMVILVEECNKCIIVGARQYQERAVEKPTTQITVMGSNDSFNENLLTTISLIRKRIKNPNLIVENFIIGKESNTDICLVYIKGLADENVLQKLKGRIKQAEIKGVVDIGFVENAIREKKFSIFPRLYYSERPDTTAANLFEGRIAICIDGTPEVMIVPALFIQFLHSTEDFHQKAIIASFFRCLRLFGFVLSLFLPALYIIMVIHHSELLPIKLLFSIAGQRNATPLPAFFELIIVLVGFDFLREAGTRMPTALGSALSFVGGIIIGQSAVEAGLISPIIVIIVAVNGIGTLLIPNYKLNLTATVLKYFFTLIAVFFGFLGFTLSVVVLITHLCSLRSFGVDYFSPLSPLSKSGMKDAIIRAPMDKVINKNRSYEQYPH